MKRAHPEPTGRRTPDPGRGPDSGLGAAWDEAVSAVEALGSSFDLGLRRYPGGGGYAWCSGYLGEPPFLLEIPYPEGDVRDAPAALRALAARLRAHADAGVPRGARAAE